MIAYFKAGNTGVLCKVTNVRHDGDPKQELPTGLFLADVEVIDDNNLIYDKGQKLTLGANWVYRLKDGACLHDLAKNREVIVRTGGKL